MCDQMFALRKDRRIHYAVSTMLSCYGGNKSQGYISTNMSVSRNNCLMEDDSENSAGNRSKRTQINMSIISVVKPVLYFIGIFKSG